VEKKMSSETKKILYEDVRQEFLSSKPLLSNKVALLFDFVKYLNSLLPIDPLTITKILDFAVPCSTDFLSHPTVIVREDTKIKLSTLGLLGGYFNCEELCLAAYINDEDEITEFFVIQTEKKDKLC
jgi:hypothetical protein